MRSRIAVAVTAVVLAVLLATGWAVWRTLDQSHSRTELIEAGIFAGLGVVVIAFMLALWLKIAPAHVLGELGKLRRTVRGLSEEQLPTLVDRLRRGEPVDVNAIIKHVEFGPDEFGDVGRAILGFGRQAATRTVEVGTLSTTNHVLSSLGRRNQALVRDQLAILAQAQRGSIDADTLATLYQLDHLAVQARRYNENLLIISGEAPGRQFRADQPVQDVLRAAAEEIQEYRRVSLPPMRAAAVLAGYAVADVIHLVSELIDNGTRFSPPHTEVMVSAGGMRGLFAIEVEDRGLGMSEEDMARYNRRLSEAPAFAAMADTAQLGLYVVGQLARRHGIQVSLRRSPYGGVSAMVVMPDVLVQAGPSTPLQPEPGAGPTVTDLRAHRSPGPAAAWPPARS
jgi:signal transduction histidine kinase